ncbi:MAG: hypothetical protein ABI870_11415 [Rhodanobacter sp.]
MKAEPHTSFIVHDRADVRMPYLKIAAQFAAQMHRMKKLAELKSDGSWANGAVLVDEGDMPVDWVVLADHRAVLWKRFTDDAATPGTMRCASEPDFFNDDVNAVLIDLCEGIVYDADGKEIHG